MEEANNSGQGEWKKQERELVINHCSQKPDWSGTLIRQR